MTVSSKLHSLYEILGADRKATDLRKAFPTVLNDGYRPAWLKFIKTAIAKDLLKYRDLGRYYVCAAFVSYISSIDDDCWADVSVNIDELNMPISVTPAYVRMREFLHLKGFSSLRKFKETKDLHYRDVGFIRAVVDPVFTGIAIYTPTGRTTLEEFLQRSVPQSFKTLPIELTKTPKLSTLLASDRNWWPLITEADLELYVGRANLNQLVFKYKIMPKAVVFYGKNKTPSAGKFLTQFKDKL